MKRFRKIYLEITNVCNLRCSFCPGTKREKRFMTFREFETLLPRLTPYTDYLYFHLMGEPLLHPELASFLQLAAQANMKAILTTNGTLLQKVSPILLASDALHKVNISVHSFEANNSPLSFDAYLQQCTRFAADAQGKCIVSFRLWNRGGLDRLNDAIVTHLRQAFDGQWVHERRGIRIGQRIYLEYGEKFDWPDLGARRTEGSVFCYGLHDQIGVLCDGTVVPCCLDHEGDIPLGNLFTQSMESILQSPRTEALRAGLCCGNPSEELCRHCGYAQRF